MEEAKRKIALNARSSSEQSASRGSRAKKWQRMYDSLLDTLHDLEGTTLERGDSNYINVDLPSGRMTVDFSKWDASRTTATCSSAAGSQGTTR